MSLTKSLPRFTAAAAAATLLFGLSACAPAKPEVTPSAEGVTPAVTVHAIDNKYEPAEVKIKKGEAVTWEFVGTNRHDVVAADGSFVSELVYEGSFTHVFDEVGTFSYICSIHPEMRGVVTVTE